MLVVLQVKEGEVLGLRLLLIAFTEEDLPIGQIRFDRQTIATDGGIHEARVTLSIDRCARGYGLAVEVVRLGLQAMEQHWGPGIEAIAEVLTTNNASNACFSRCSFTKEQISTDTPAVPSVNRWRKAYPYHPTQ